MSLFSHQDHRILAKLDAIALSPDSFCSCAHGAGRRMLRTQAKKQFNKADMERRGQGAIGFPAGGWCPEGRQAEDGIDMNETELKILTKALAFAAHKHRDQRRKDPSASPYINHPIALVDILVNEGGINQFEVLCGAILHDTVEDTETTEKELREAFGEDISRIVMEVTDDKSLEKHERKRAQVKHSPHLSTEAKAVKLADKISNLRDVEHSPPSDWPLERRQQYFDWAKEVIDGLRREHPELEAIFDRQYRNRPG